MTGKLKIEIVKSVETLSRLLKQERNPQKKERIKKRHYQELVQELAESEKSQAENGRVPSLQSSGKKRVFEIQLGFF